MDFSESVFMSTIEKLIIKMQQQPHGIRLAEADRVLEEYGYKFHWQRGSHRHYINGRGEVVSLKDENPLKAVYIKAILSNVVK